MIVRISLIAIQFLVIFVSCSGPIWKDGVYVIIESDDFEDCYNLATEVVEDKYYHLKSDCLSRLFVSKYYLLIETNSNYYILEKEKDKYLNFSELEGPLSLLELKERITYYKISDLYEVDPKTGKTIEDCDICK